jgi:hypothetical protein
MSQLDNTSQPVIVGVETSKARAQEACTCHWRCRTKVTASKCTTFYKTCRVRDLDLDLDLEGDLEGDVDADALVHDLLPKLPLSTLVRSSSIPSLLSTITLSCSLLLILSSFLDTSIICISLSGFADLLPPPGPLARYAFHARHTGGVRLVESGVDQRSARSMSGRAIRPPLAR